MNPIKPQIPSLKKSSQNLSEIVNSSSKPHKTFFSPLLKPKFTQSQIQYKVNPKVNTSLILSQKTPFSDDENPKEEDLKFKNFFKLKQEKKYVKQGKTTDISCNLPKKNPSRFFTDNTSKFSCEPPEKTDKNTVKKPAVCPFKELKDNWLEKTTINSQKKLINQHGGTIFERIGTEKFSLILKGFLNKIWKNSMISGYFLDKNYDKIHDNLSAFFSKHLNQYVLSMESMTVSLLNTHKILQISHEKFDVFKGLFAITLREFEIEEELVLEFLLFLEKTRKIIVFEKSAFEKAQEENSIDKISLIEKIVEKIQKNSLLNNFFEKWDILQHRKHLTQIFDFLEKNQMVSEIYLRENHKKLAISSEIFYHFKQVFIFSFREIKISEELIFEIIDKLETLRVSLLDERSFYDILSEKNDVNEIIRRFVDNIKGNSILSELFKKTPYEKLFFHCKLMMEFCLKGPTGYLGCDITPAHIGLKLNNSHYSSMREVFEKTLFEAKIREKDRTYILADLDYYKYDICNEKCLFEKFRDQKNVDYVINSFYLKAFQHPKLCGFYKNTDPLTMIKKQKFFFAKLFQAKKIKSYHFKDLRTFHLNMEMKEEHFKIFVEILGEITKELQIKDGELQKEIVDWIVRVKNDVLNKKDQFE